MILRGEEGTADFTAASDLPIYKSGYYTFETVGEEVDFTVKPYDDTGVLLAEKPVYLESRGSFVETLSYHETLDYTVIPGDQYTIEVVGWNFGG